MKSFGTILVAVILSTLAAFIVVKTQSSVAPVAVAKKETLFEKLQRTKTLKCAYITWSKSYFAKDPNTGKFKGIGYELAEAAAKVLEIKIDWAEEVGMGNMYEGLKTGRYDAICTPVILDATVAAHGLPVEPAGLTPLYAYGRADDTRFLENDPDALVKINNPSVRLVDVDGTNGVEIHKNRYPQAHLISMPGTMTGSEIIQQVALKKADITQQNPALVEDFMKLNPGVLKRITAKPLMVYPNSPFILPIGEWDAKSWIDQAVISMKNIGTIDTMMQKFDPDHKFFLEAE
ncbi:MAG TPA: transporter substrate-binding domain-containing protein [Alphaproteobacteria bacterium]